MQEALSGGIIFEANQVRKDGAFFPVEISAQGIVIGDETLVSQVIRDISERKRIEDNLRYFAYHDALTRVPNRFVLKVPMNKLHTGIIPKMKSGLCS